MANHPVVCQKSDFYGNSDFQNSEKLFVGLQIPAKKIFRTKYARLLKIFWCKKLTHGALQK
jgi:hypothetical protein